MLVLETYRHVGSLANPIMDDPYPLHVYISYTAMAARVKRVDCRLLEYRNVGFVFIHSEKGEHNILSSNANKKSVAIWNVLTRFHQNQCH